MWIGYSREYGWFGFDKSAVNSITDIYSASNLVFLQFRRRRDLWGYNGESSNVVNVDASHVAGPLYASHHCNLEYKLAPSLVGSHQVSQIPIFSSHFGKLRRVLSDVA
jgi:hypothetical protein